MLSLLPLCACRWHEYTSADALQGFKTELLKRKGLPPDTPIEVVKVCFACCCPTSQGLA